MGLISLLFSNPALFVILAILLLYSVIIHEIAHGWAAYLFGDDTAMRSGRLSLNPMFHLDPVGTIMLFIVGFGWAKPVPVDYSRLKNFRLGLISVSLAGCLANILIAAIALFLLRAGIAGSNPTAVFLLSLVARINIILGAVNLIPIPPLDGSKILMGFLPRTGQAILARFDTYGLLLLMLLLFSGLLNPVIMFMQKAILSMLGFLFGMVR
ncbi:MAG: site-2 protease family protein [Candidatus Omnitrophica bacterium]|nr:site-2 protease family protein [Candidatus Omnitrophota bacterium]